ncbi:MAG: hypothetical protein NTV51_06345 [Verrucomicrobia bacterium]|nr:hypothetical protein [Verrucomicrobiota bacterium]
MPRRILSAVQSSLTLAKAGPAKKPRLSGLVRQTAQGALLAAGLAITQTDDKGAPKWRLFDPGLLDRLSAPLTRYHE